MTNHLSNKRIAYNAIFMASYITLCIIFKPISYGDVQVRIAEALCILPMFDSFSVYSITLGCMVSNIIGGGIVVDVIFGSLATFIGLFLIKYIKVNNFFIKMLPTILSNTIIIPFVLRYGYGFKNMPLFISGCSIAIGEIISVYILGFILYKTLIRLKLFEKF